MFEGLKQWSGRLPLPRWLQRRGAPAVVALMYHDLRADDDFPNWMRVSVTDFERQIDACAAMGPFISPEALLEPCQIPDDRLSFLLTFDDGYHNNAALAVPVMERRGIEALFFVSTGPMVRQQPFWTDVVITPIQVLRLSHLDLRDQGFGRFEFRLQPEPERWDDIQRLLLAVKTAGNEDHPRVVQLLAWLEDAYGQILADHLPRFRPLACWEVQGMAARGGCHFGSHGHDHRILTRLDDGELARSLVHSRALLADLTGQAILQLAYPNGDHDARVRAAAARAGYQRAFSARSGLLTGRLAALELPRIAVGAFDKPGMLRFKIHQRMLAACWGRRSRGLAFLDARRHD